MVFSRLSFEAFGDDDLKKELRARGFIFPGDVVLSARDQYMDLRANRTGMVMDQIAIYVSSPEEERMAKAAWGLQDAEWVEDYVTGHGTLFGEELPKSVAHLRFNYDLGIELELLTYLEGDNWHKRTNWEKLRDRKDATVTAFTKPLLSHIGFHVNDQPMPDLPFPLVQELFTDSHTNQHIQGRSYHYRIYDTRPMNGVFSKYIRRVR